VGITTVDDYSHVTELSEQIPQSARTEPTEPTIRLGTPFGPYEGHVDPDAAIAFGLATSDVNPAYGDGQAVPPLYSVALVLPALDVAIRNSVDDGAIFGANDSVHGEQDMYFHAPLQPDSTVQWSVTTHSAHQTLAGVLVTQRILVSDTVENPLVDHYWSSLHVGGTTLSTGGPPLADHRYPENARQHKIGTETLDIALDQAFRYAGVSNDHAPHSLDDDAARQQGFPSKILQGMCTLAMCGGAVLRVAGVDDPNGLRRLAARFAAPVFPKRELTVEVADLGTTAEGYRAVAFEACSNGVVCIGHGRAEFGIEQ
jgi:acyl dehydratase